MHNWKRFSALLLVLALFLLSRPAAALLGSPEEGEEISGAPIAQDLEIQVYCGVAYAGTFSAIDNEGEAITFAIDQAPKKGTVAVQDDGVTFLYTPSDRKTGSDSFTYTATDASGNVSAPATVHITISKQKTGVRYSDMSGHSAQTAAICLAEEGICVGRQVGNTWFFDPEETVSRSEFLAMAMTAAGLEAEDTAAVTTFSDDAAISAWARGYAAAASQAGILSGVSTDQGAAFRGEDPISFNEAATVLDRLMNVTDVQIPEGQTTWAAQAMANMESVQVVSAGSFGAGSLTVTRADAAQMLSAALPFLQEEDEGWFSSLF